MEKKSWISKLDEIEGDEPHHSQKRKNRQLNMGGFSGIGDLASRLGRPPEHLYPYIAAGAGVVLLILLVVVFTRGGGEESPDQNLQAISAQLQNVEQRLQKIEEWDEQRQKAFADFWDSSQNLERQLEMQRENIDDMRQKLAALEGRPAAPVTRERAATPEPQRTGGGEGTQHEVQRGDTLFSLSMKYGISVDRLRELNNLSPGDLIHPGQKLVVSD